MSSKSKIKAVPPNDKLLFANDKVHFPGLNGIRAIASMTVLFWHIDEFSMLFGVKCYGFYVTGFSRNAVDMFFCLSGFLITFLLLKEKERFGTIDITKFYVRRILRIWPLYYLAIIITYVMTHTGMFPEQSDFLNRLMFYVFLMANVAFFLKLAIPSILPLWSVGVEEQFYLIWPMVIKNSSKHLLTIGCAFLLVHIIRLLGYYDLSIFKSWYKFLNISRVDIMMLGALGAVIVYNNMAIVNIIYRAEIQIIAWFILISSYFYGPIHVVSFIDYQLNAIVYIVIIINVATNERTLLTIDNAIFNFLGKISYGIYIYHMLVIFSLAHLQRSYGISFAYFTYVTITVSLTLLIAWISYNKFEKRFIKMKYKYSLIKSSPVSHEY